MLMNGNKILRLRKPGIANVLRVANKFTTEIVVLIPAKYTPKISISCTPLLVYAVFDENGVINVHPATVCVALEQRFITFFFLSKILELKTKDHKPSGIIYRYVQKNNFHAKFIFPQKLLKLVVFLTILTSIFCSFKNPVSNVYTPILSRVGVIKLSFVNR
jgi:hypothetical protein